MTARRHARVFGSVWRTWRAGPLLMSATLVCACSGPQSALDPAGKEARDLMALFQVLASGAAVIFVLVFGLFVYVARLKTRPSSRFMAEVVIVGGGIALPLLVLTALLLWTLPLMPMQRAAGSGLRVHVTGHQWWWKVEYRVDGRDAAVISANELRLPVDMRTEISLSADKVIHSFWIPALGGKVDMFPGRETRMALEPFRTGVFRGQCAEFCGTAHADMSLQAVVMEKGAFNEWLSSQARPAAAPANELAQRGKAVFLREGCGACHTVRGTQANGKVGPDLTHFGSRAYVGAGVLPNTTEGISQWVENAAKHKPHVKMPSYEFLSEDDLNALAHFLEGLT